MRMRIASKKSSDEDNNPHRGCHKALAFNTLLSSQETDTHPRTPTQPGRHPAGATLLTYPTPTRCQTLSRELSHHVLDQAPQPPPAGRTACRSVGSRACPRAGRLPGVLHPFRATLPAYRLRPCGPNDLPGTVSPGPTALRRSASPRGREDFRQWAASRQTAVARLATPLLKGLFRPSPWCHEGACQSSSCRSWEPAGTARIRAARRTTVLVLVADISPPPRSPLGSRVGYGNSLTSLGLIEGFRASAAQVTPGSTAAPPEQSRGSVATPHRWRARTAGGRLVTGVSTNGAAEVRLQCQGLSSKRF